MKVFLIFSITVLLSLITCQVSLIDLINKSKGGVQNCQILQGGICAQCKSGFELQAGKCIANSSKTKIVSPPPTPTPTQNQNQYIPNSNFTPCKGAQYCGESKGFQSQADLQSYIKSKTEQPIAKPLIISPPAQSNNKIPLFPSDLPSKPLQPQALIVPEAESAKILPIQPQAFIPPQPPQPQYYYVAPPSTPVVDPQRDFSGTNNQEQNVDEADILKTDGTYIYTISNRILSIILAYPSQQAKALSTIDLTFIFPRALFIEKNYLCVFGTVTQNVPQAADGYNVIKIYDVSNRLLPFQIKEYVIEGRYFDGRKTLDGFIYLIATNSPSRAPPSNPAPLYSFNGINSAKKNLAFDHIYSYPDDELFYVEPIFINVLTFDLANPNSNARNIISLLTQRLTTLYMSDNSIYLTYTDRRGSEDYTIIHKLFLFKQFIVPFADTVIKGYVENQFSMDEYNSILRVATTQISPVSNNVYTFDFFLTQMGKLENIAPYERIQSARYVNRKLYLLAFKQTSPFFVIGFENHRFPQILGELRLTGYSRYLHPYDDNTVIGIGRQANVIGNAQGLKISLFDVSNVKFPREIQRFQLEERYAVSTAEYEHKAFLFSLEKNLLVIPTRLNQGEDKFNGALIFKISKNQITLKAIIDHLINPSDIFDRRNVERNLYIEEILYSKSKCLLTLTNLSDYIRVKTILVPCLKNDLIKPPSAPAPPQYYIPAGLQQIFDVIGNPASPL